MNDSRMRADEFGPECKEPLSDDEIDRMDDPVKMTSILVQCGLEEKRLANVGKEQLRNVIITLSAFKRECFRKNFQRWFGRTGGTVDGVCEHCVLYCSKTIVSAESPKDAVALLLLLQHLPHCAWFDFWCGASRELVARCADIGIDLGPRAGALFAETDLADRKDSLPVSIPAFQSQCLHSMSLLDTSADEKKAFDESDIKVNRPPHPYTCSCVFLALHDRLHGTPHENCRARDADNVSELRGANTIRSEHFNVLRKRIDHFLRNESPQRNMFLHLVFAHRYNRRRSLRALSKARKRLAKLQEADPSVRLGLNEFGQLTFTRDPTHQAPAGARS